MLLALLQYISSSLIDSFSLLQYTTYSSILSQSILAYIYQNSIEQVLANLVYFRYYIYYSTYYSLSTSLNITQIQRLNNTQSLNTTFILFLYLIILSLLARQLSISSYIYLIALSFIYILVAKTLAQFILKVS